MNNNSQKKNDIVKLFLRAARSHHQLFENRAMEFGVHRSQHKILMYLSRHEDEFITQKDIASEFEISAAAVAVSVRKLEDEGLITRKSAESDNRANIILLTERGMQIVERTRSLINGIDEAMFHGFGQDEITEFSAFLSRLCDNIKKYDEKTKGADAR